MISELTRDDAPSADPSTETIVETQSLGKIYLPSPRWMRFLLKTAIQEPVAALTDVSFSLGAGQICAIVGPNGAGKSTLFRLLTGLTTPTTGSAVVAGYDCEADSVAVRRHIGFMPPEDRALFLRHDCAENLRFHGRMHGMKDRELEQRIGDVLELVGLGDARDRVGFALSSGMRSRLQLAIAVLHNPRLLILDEPTGAVDPLAAQEFLGILQRLADESGVAVLISSHRLEEIEALDDNLALIDQGRLVYWGDLDAMRQIWEQSRHRLHFAESDSAALAAERLRASGFDVETRDEDGVEVVGAPSLGPIFDGLQDLTASIVAVNEVRLSLRDLLSMIIDHGRLQSPTELAVEHDRGVAS